MALISSISDISLLEDLKLYGRDSSVPVGVETVLLNHTVVSNQVVLMSLVIGGNDNGLFRFKINGTEYLQIRNSWTNRTQTHDLGSQIADIGDSIIVSVINRGELTNTFEARLNGKKL